MRCSVDGCQKTVKVRIRQLCQLHYGRFWRGEPMHRAPKPTMREVFERRFKPGDESECWIWAGGTDKDGYGLFTYRGMTYRATRLMWRYTFCSVPPKGIQVCHRCDNPPCMNPAHLFLGSQLDNSLDMMRKGRWKGSPTTKLTLAQVDRMRQEYTGTFGDKARLARQYGISTAQASKIINGECWTGMVRATEVLFQ